LLVGVSVVMVAVAHAEMNPWRVLEARHGHGKRRGSTASATGSQQTSQAGADRYSQAKTPTQAPTRSALLKAAYLYISKY